MRVLIACEFSGTVRDAFRRAGHDAWSVDLLPCDKGPDWHYEGNAGQYLCPEWDLLIAHPPCTALCVSGNRYYAGTTDRDEALDFFRLFLDAPIAKIAVENPVGVTSTRIRRPDQWIQPHHFGHPESKKTGLWLKGLAALQATDILTKPDCGYWDNQTPSGQNKLGPSPDRWKLRAATYTGIAKAMATQWGGMA